MPVVRGGDDDGVDVFAREHFAVIAGGEDVAAPLFFRASQPAFVNVAHRNELRAWHADRGRCVA